MDENISDEVVKHLLADIVVETNTYWELIRLSSDNFGHFLHYLGGYVYRAEVSIYFKAHDLFIQKGERFTYTLSKAGKLDPNGKVHQTFTVERR